MTLPVAVYSQLGPVPVAVVAKLAGGDWGKFRYEQRAMEIARGQCDIVMLATLGHEMAHIALHDSGVDNGLAEEKLEAICDAIGTYIAAAVQQGYLQICVPG